MLGKSHCPGRVPVRIRKNLLYWCEGLAQRSLNGGARLSLGYGDRLIIPDAMTP